MKKFSEFLSEATNSKEIVFAFGRFNPPTIGHEKLMDKVASASKGGTYRIYPSQSIDPKKNPLKFDEKVKFMRKMFPKHARSIIADKKVKTAIDVVTKLYDQGYTKVTMVVGSDRVSEFETLLNKYNGVKARHGYFNFKDGVQIVSAGERDPDSDDVSGMSASKLRAAASANDFEVFSKGMPSNYKDAQALFNAIRTGMGLKESYDFRKHVKLESVSEAREAYVRGELFKEGDMVESMDNQKVGQVVLLGTNYVLVEYTDGSRSRKWISDVRIVEESVAVEVEVFNISEMKVQPVTPVARPQLNTKKYSALMQKMHEDRKGKTK
jgi:phosphopantetheine adenylyltransferase